MWGVVRLQVHGICSRRLVYKKVAEARSNYKRSYFWWFEIPACGNSTEIDQIEKDQGRVSPILAWEKEQKEHCDLVCVERL